MAEERAPKGSRKTILAILVILVAGAYGAKLYYQHTQETDTERRQALAEQIEAVDASIRAALPKEQARWAGALQEHDLTSWFPATLRCGGASMPLPKDAPPLWREALGAEQPARFMWRAEVIEEDLVVWARRDVDCDGLYEVHRMVRGSAEVQNLGE